MAHSKEPKPEVFFPPHHRKGLFGSEPWNKAWLKHWGDHPKLQPLKAHPDQTPEFYRFKAYKKGVIPITTALPLGASSSVARSIRCEYFRFSSASSRLEQQADEYLQRALQHPWDQLALKDVLVGSDEHQALLTAAARHNLYVVEQDPERTYAIDLRQRSFESYLSTLGKNTRLKLFNRRKKLAETGNVEITNLWPDRDSFFKLLNDFHQKRWGKPCYNGRNLAFMHDLLAHLDEAGQTVDLSVLSVSGRPMSCALDITAQQRCYNLQSGYHEDAIKGVSLGTLHLGYQIERAFEVNAEVYDFMAGSGKNSQYKAPLSTMSAEVVSLLLVKSAVLKLAYKVRSGRQPNI